MVTYHYHDVTDVHMDTSLHTDINGSLTDLCTNTSSHSPTAPNHCWHLYNWCPDACVLWFVCAILM